MNVMSLFGGMECGRIAVDVLGFEIDKYYSSEIDKYAVIVTQANWSDVIQLGDVTKWHEWDVDWSNIDLLIGGSPCQGFSVAGKQLAFEDPRSKLFYVYDDILNYIRFLNPDVKFLLENVKMKKESLNVITSTLGVEPVFINSNLVSAQNRQRWYWTNVGEIDQPEDKGVMLCDILENDGQGVIKRDGVIMLKNEKSQCIDANYYKGVDNHGQRTMIAVSYNRKDKIRHEIFKSHPLSASDYRGLNRNQNQTAIIQNGSLRKMTPIECERLQTVPDNYTNHVSNTQRYKMLGNGMTVDVIVHILKNFKAP
jgi:DNA-cytosine methyltransferase